MMGLLLDTPWRVHRWTEADRGAERSAHLDRSPKVNTFSLKGFPLARVEGPEHSPSDPTEVRQAPKGGGSPEALRVWPKLVWSCQVTRHID